MNRAILHLFGRSSRSCSHSHYLTSLHRRSLHSDLSVFAEGDRVLLTSTKHLKQSILTKPLQYGSKNKIIYEHVKDDYIIGKTPRDAVLGSKGTSYRVTLPTLDEYITLTPRKVTPIYNSDANLIVSLLDIHVFPLTPSNSDCKPIEILEAGTGHGSLTLHLARAVHAANSAPPNLPPLRTPKRAPTAGEANAAEEEDETSRIQRTSDQEAYNVWKSKRGAIIHSIDISEGYSLHAETVVRGFRRGMYAGSIDLYVGHVEDWIASQIGQRQGESNPIAEPFLSYAILDMPSAHQQLANVAPVLHSDGLIAVFMPNISQIAECEELAYKSKLSLILEKVVELGTGISGGRLWDVRFTKPRKREVTRVVADETASDSTSNEESSDMESGEENTSSINGGLSAKDKMVLVCRPKVGERIVGGGFVGIWRKMKASPDEVPVNLNN